MNVILFIIFTIFVFPGTAIAENHRSFCLRYYPGVNLSDCIYYQEAAANRMRSNIYDNFVVRTCLDQGKRVDRIASYTDYVFADECAKTEQRRLDEQEAIRASAARDRAAAELYYEKTRTEREYKRKLYIIQKDRQRIKRKQR